MKETIIGTSILLFVVILLVVLLVFSIHTKEMICTVVWSDETILHGKQIFSVRLIEDETKLVFDLSDADAWAKSRLYKKVKISVQDLPVYYSPIVIQGIE